MLLARHTPSVLQPTKPLPTCWDIGSTVDQVCPSKSL